MSFVHVWLTALPVLLVMAIVAWAVATARRNVGLVDIVWSLFFLAALAVYATAAGPEGPRAVLLLAIVGVWSLRLSVYLALRNWNAPEDHRYRAIRARNEPGFVWKSLYLVFGLQALLAWLISAPLAGALRCQPSWRARCSAQISARQRRHQLCRPIPNGRLLHRRHLRCRWRALHRPG